MATRKTASEKPEMLRVQCLEKVQGSLDRKKEILSGYSVITRGEALGHGMWIDETFLSQVEAAGNASPSGIKTRYTHPGLSADGLGSALARTKNFSLSGNKVLADMHFLKSAHRSPNGDLSGYIMDLVEEGPDLLGASIVFSRDFAAEEEFATGHMEKDGKNKRFVSPDSDNVQNFPHIRLGELHNSDVVDEPAANPDGMFSFSAGNEFAMRAEELLKYLFGLRDDAPANMLGLPHPERMKSFFEKFLLRHGLILSGDVLANDKRKGRNDIESICENLQRFENFNESAIRHFELHADRLSLVEKRVTNLERGLQLLKRKGAFPK